MITIPDLIIDLV